jgi:hypothetical protein
MVKGKAGARAPNRRGSPEAIEKRRAGRRFNDLLSGRGGGRPSLDGRTEKRRQRLLHELSEGTTRSLRPLKPLDVLLRVDELLSLGEPLSSIRKVAKAKKTGLSPESIVDAVGQLHTAYHFRPETYRFVGIGEDVLRSAGVLSAEPKAHARRGVTPANGAPGGKRRRA